MDERCDRASEQDKLSIVSWASHKIEADRTQLTIEHGPGRVLMPGAPNITGTPLVANSVIGADLIRLPARSGFEPHIHPGHHILSVLAGEGTITYGASVYRTEPGQTFLIAGSVPHAVGSITDHVILAVGSPHLAVDAENRMEPVPYEAVSTPLGDLTCTICDLTALLPIMLHDLQCPHCPCRACTRDGGH
jgi:quercetin dioxygenase-like cupin family protein